MSSRTCSPGKECQDLRKLGTAMAAMIRITATTRSNSIKEKPLWLRMNTPQASASVGGRGPGGARPKRNPSSGDASSHAGDSSPNRSAEKAILLWYHRGHGQPGGGIGAGWREYATPKSDWSWRLRIPSIARSSARQGAEAEALRMGCWPQHAGGDEKNSGKKVSGATHALGLKARALFWIMKSVHRANRELYSLVLRRSQSVTIFVGSTASLSICNSTTLPLLSIR